MLIALRGTVSTPDTQRRRNRVGGAGLTDPEMLADRAERPVFDLAQSDGLIEGFTLKARFGRGASMGRRQAKLVGLDLQGMDAAAW